MFGKDISSYIKPKQSCLFIFILIASPFVFLLIYILWSVTFPSIPNRERAKELLIFMSFRDVPDSFTLIYSRHYKDLLSSNICFVFSYPEGYYDISQDRFNYLNQNQSYEDEDFIIDLDEYIPESQGCNKFMSKLDNHKVELFMEYDYSYEGFGGGEGLKIFVNEKDNLVVFEGFLHD